ncbi:hypothetical protein ACFZDJ_05895 [Streptomyces sp. NPDC007896]|uniref:hypothetical protein n=1 Tax=Streptomyces sp. NPDC007896 TaxID=3364784 RepID=UPI0036ECD6E7
MLDHYQGVATEVAAWSPVADDVEVATIFNIAPPPQQRRCYHAVALCPVTGFPGL